MPCNLLSGLPGNGKTLRLLQRVRKLQLDTKRPVYYFDIRLKGSELSDWIPLGDPSTFGRRKEGIEPDLSQVRRWHEIVPSGSIVVIDECWFVFPKRGPSAAVPKHVEELATHRHRGIDLFLTSQHAANQIDHFVRGLVQEHEHVVRLGGTETARIHRWAQGIGDPSDYHSRKASATQLWRFPKEVYEWYHSAEVHTIKRQVPFKPVGMIVGGLALVALLGYWGYSRLTGNLDAGADAVKASAAPAASASGSGPIRTAARKVVDVADFVPTVNAAPFSAPFYADGVKVKAAPQIAGCGSLVVGDKVECTCFTQQGTAVDMTVRTCLKYLKAGSFRFDRDEDYYPKVEPYVPPLAEPAPDQQQAPSNLESASSSEEKSA